MTKWNRIARWSLFASFGLLLIVFAAYLSPPAIAAQFFEAINLVTDDPLIKPAPADRP